MDMTGRVLSKRTVNFFLQQHQYLKDLSVLVVQPFPSLSQWGGLGMQMRTDRFAY